MSGVLPAVDREPAVVGFFHAGLTVSLIETALPFYRDVLGLRIFHDTVRAEPYIKRIVGLSCVALRIVYLEIPGGGYLELLEYQGVERQSAAARPCDPGSGHVCLFAENVDGLLARIHAAGYSSRSEQAVTVTDGPNEGARVVYLRDPDGNLVELFERPQQVTG